MGPVTLISPDTHSHAKHQIAYDPVTGYMLVVWRNYSGITGLYNITGRFLGTDLTPLGTDFLIADGVADGKQYDYPSVAGGRGKFFVGYTNYNSPYEVYGKIIASGGSIETAFQIGNTGYSGRSFLGVAYNGTGFVVAWTDSTYDIYSRNYDLSGNVATPTNVIAGTSDTEITQDVDVDPGNATYYFVWWDSTTTHVLGSLWTESEVIPELGYIMPVLATIAVIVTQRRRRFRS